MKANSKNSFFICSPSNKLKETIVNEILKTKNGIEFHSSLPNYEATPLVLLPKLSKKYNVGSIYIKDESTRFGLNAFKILGASYAIDQLLKKDPTIETFCTATDGNHGKAVAKASKFMNKNSVVYVPEHTVKDRIAAIEKEGAKVEKVKGSYDDACDHAIKMSKLNGWCLVQDTSSNANDITNALIMKGYLTMFQEMEDTIHTLPKSKIDVLFLQAGVGSFASAAVFYYLERYSANRPKIVLIEPRKADNILYSFQQDELSTIPYKSKTIMAGLCCETPSAAAWNLLNSGIDVAIKIEDKYAIKAMQELYFPKGNDPQIISGESGAAGLAGFLAILKENEFRPVREMLEINKNSRLLFINTEGATDISFFNKTMGL